ncbi:MAG TPA: YihY/virulence factor BrkB family protein [Gaiellales bacterium]|nr:YihY/virulence factor BrkB family protein [Gaiellales bacterium]
MAARTERPLRHPLRSVARHTPPFLSKFVADRGPHLAAMVAYYALLSLVPFLFLSLALLGLAGPVDARSSIVRELSRILPDQSVGDLLHAVQVVQGDARTFGAIGLLGMIWASLGFYSALESAFNVVWDVSNRGFLHQKWVTFVGVAVSLFVLFCSLVLATAATGWVQRHDAGLFDIRWAAYAVGIAVSATGTFTFLSAVYRYLPNVDLRRGDVWRGALASTVLLQLSFQALPLYLRFSDQLVALRALGGLVILLVWLYLMANIVVLGAEINWQHWRSRQPDEVEVDGLA